MTDSVESNSPALDLFRAAPHVRLHQGRTMVIKVGGAALTRAASLERFARQVSVVQALGARVVVVHGGGTQTDELQRMFGEEPRMVDGRRVTSPTALRALSMATAGELNGAIVSALAGMGVPAVGVSGASAGLLVAERRPPVPTSEGMVDFGEVGDLRKVDPTPLRALLEAGRTLNRWRRVEPERVSVHIALLDLALEMKDGVAAEELAENLRRVAGDDPEAWQRLVRYYAGQRDRVRQAEAEAELGRLRRAPR